MSSEYLVRRKCTIFPSDVSAMRQTNSGTREGPRPSVNGGFSLMKPISALKLTVTVCADLLSYFVLSKTALSSWTRRRLTTPFICLKDTRSFGNSLTFASKEFPYGGCFPRMVSRR